MVSRLSRVNRLCDVSFQFRGASNLLWLFCVLSRLILALGDCYMHNPRGSNNKLTEQNNNAQNNQRLFDSQNNNAGGYQVGDNCVPNCKNGNAYDPNKEGSQRGVMYYYHTSELHIEWTSQHSCGNRDASVEGTNTHCQIVLQYMCDSDVDGVRDGKDPDNARRRRGGGQNQANRDEAAQPTRGQHEPFDFYDACKRRERNKGLYVADRNLNDNIGATATRQNNNGQRRGLECPEERDYYPYWHATPWRDIAILTDTPEKHCEMYRRESQNVIGKNRCKIAPEEDTVVPNNEKSCKTQQGTWELDPPWDIDPPLCQAMPESRDNHLGNIQTGKAMSFVWHIPETIPDNSQCVLRIRYNISSGDFDNDPEASETKTTELFKPVSKWDPFFDLDASYNDDKALLKNDPKDDFVGLGWGKSGPLQLQVNTAQFGRVFQDRSHVFVVKKRPDNIPSRSRIVNFNVRGRRGNIVQVYPSVEYDFVPQDLQVKVDDIIHFQWTGSDANANGNAGNGRQGTDRNNLVQMPSRDATKPMSADKHTLLFNARDSGLDSNGEALIEKFAFLDQETHIAKRQKTCPKDLEEAKNVNDNSDDNCLQLNAAPAYFDGGLVKMTVVGEHHVASTRNNDYTNRSQKATIKVLRRTLLWWEVFLIVLAVVLFLLMLIPVVTAISALQRPTSAAFAKKNRPLLLRLPCLRGIVQRKESERSKYKHELAKAMIDRSSHATTRGDVTASVVGAKGLGSRFPAATPTDEEFSATVADKPFGSGCISKCCSTIACCCRPCKHVIASGAWQAYAAFWGINLLVGVAGFFINYGRGFNNWYPVAKCGGYLLDFNLSVLLLPTLRSIQGLARQVRALDILFNADPIDFHIKVAIVVFMSTLIHVVGHICHVAAIVQGPVFVNPITPRQTLSGRTVASIIFDPATRFAPFTGLIILVLMFAMGLTAHARIRRHTFNFRQLPRTFRDIVAWIMLAFVGLLLIWAFPFWWIWKRCQSNTTCSRQSWIGKLGGFHIFWSVHKNWIPIYILLLVHGPQCWIWFLWPLVLLCCDRLVSRDRRQEQVTLKSATLLKGEVLKLVLTVPRGFSYQAGHYVQVCCDQVNPEEWHPFTLTSAPEEDHLSVHIRCPDQLDWCSAMRRLLVENAVKTMTGVDYKKGTICRVSYKPFHQQRIDGYGNDTPSIFHAVPAALETLRADGVVTSRIDASPAPPEGRPSFPMRKKSPKMVKERGSGDDEERDAETAELSPMSHKQSNVSMVSLEDLFALPQDVVRIRLDGPHGAPSELVWKHRVCMLVGAGIGVTPFASVLRSLNLNPRCMGLPTKSKKTASSDQKGEDVFVPCQSVHFYWICRGQEEFEWFYDLLREAVEGPNKNRIEVHLFQTGLVEVGKVEPLGCGFHQFIGKPNWAKSAGQLAKAHAGESIGVFFCGNPAIRKDLENVAQDINRQSSDGTQFRVYAENF
eukprot:TRINITY_DN21494_c0_g1_i1.p1 TRINITY_DN21494_c0_g1~~TRINITY_DN21494_c0_g1_i1.p1  ORF type:complete len:1467 (+),score=227.03 TRINITY_DN21494_c0_g1_i1:51-4403(+)